MTRMGVLAALMALACGSAEDGVAFDDAGHSAGSAGVAGAPTTSGGASTTAGADGGNEAGEPSVAGSAGQQAGGAGGTKPVGVSGSTGGGAGGSVAGGGGSSSTAAGSGGAAAGTASGGSSQAGSSAEAGKGGGPEPIECSGTQLDCDENPDCEAYMGDDGNCGECGKKCGVSQMCKLFGTPDNWSAGCVSK